MANVKAVHQQVDGQEPTLRLALDSQAAVRLGPFSRGGQSRTGTSGVDHAFKPEGALTPFGLFEPKTAPADRFLTDAKGSSDFMADCREQGSVERGAALKDIRKLVLDLDNGPETSGQRGSSHAAGLSADSCWRNCSGGNWSNSHQLASA